MLLDTFSFAENLKGKRWIDEDLKAFNYLEEIFDEKPDKNLIGNSL